MTVPNQWTAEQDRRLLLEVVNSFSPTISPKLWNQIGPVLGVTPKACKERFFKLKKDNNAAATTEKVPVTPTSTKKTTSDPEQRPATPEKRTPSPRKRKTVNYAEFDEPDNTAESIDQKFGLEQETGKEWRLRDESD